MIILVEDDAGVRRSLQLLLYAQGYDVRAFASSTALLPESAGQGAVCLVTDYRMPELDGFAVLRVLRKREWNGPAILITAYHSRQLVERAKQEGFSVVLEKPLREHTLVAAVSRLVAGVGSNVFPGG